MNKNRREKMKMLKLKELRVLVLCVFIPMFAGCVTTQERPDGSTHVRVSFSEALGMKKKPGNAQVQPPPRASAANAPAQPNSPEVMAAWQKAAPLIQKALECREFYDLSKPPFNALVPPFDDCNMQWVATPPVPIKVFGLPIKKFRFYIDLCGEDMGSVSFFENASLTDIQKAAKLKPVKTHKFGIRKTRVGVLAANIEPDLTLGCYTSNRE